MKTWLDDLLSVCFFAGIPSGHGASGKWIKPLELGMLANPLLINCFLYPYGHIFSWLMLLIGTREKQFCALQTYPSQVYTFKSLRSIQHIWFISTMHCIGCFKTKLFKQNTKYILLSGAISWWFLLPLFFPINMWLQLFSLLNHSNLCWFSCIH